jgi:hypothetical protein
MIGSGEPRPSAPQCKTRNPISTAPKMCTCACTCGSEALDGSIREPWVNPPWRWCRAPVSMENEWQCRYSGSDIGRLLAIKVSNIWYPDSNNLNGSMHAKHRAKMVVVWSCRRLSIRDLNIAIRYRRVFELRVIHVFGSHFKLDLHSQSGTRHQDALFLHTIIIHCNRESLADHEAGTHSGLGALLFTVQLDVIAYIVGPRIRPQKGEMGETMERWTCNRNLKPRKPHSNLPLPTINNE